MNIESLKNIERWNVLLGILLTIGAALLMSRADVLGVAVGAALSCANFTIMRRMVMRWMRTPPKRRGPQMLLLVPKMSGLMLAVFLALWFLPVTGIGVLIGFSVFLLSIAIETVRYTVSGGGDDAAEETRLEGETDGI